MSVVPISSTEVRPERRIEQNPYDVDAWNILLREAQRKSIGEARPFYERLVLQFPNAGRFWRCYIEHELKSRSYENVEKLFQRCLMKILNIDLWRCYINYVRETKGSLPSFREKMAQAYDFALDKIGLDSLSHHVYMDYVTFLKNVPAVGSYAENQKITAVRKIYQRAIITPLLNIELIWNEYCSYEKAINAQLAEKLIAERSKDYQNAKKVAKSMEVVMRGIHRSMISIPPRGTPSEMKQVNLWKKYIAWEKENPLGTEDYGLFAKRVVFAYEQSLLCLGFNPDMWYEAALFMQDAAKTLAEKGDAKASGQLLDEIAVLYDRATTTILKDKQLLYFAYADYEEERMRYDKVAQIYNRFVEQPDVDPSLAYIQYMKFARRTESIKSARAVFKRAREDPRSRCQIYVAAALMEYYCCKDPNVAFKIFELGMKKYMDQPEYAIAYIEFLIHLNEDNNTRVLFERILSANSGAEKSLELWDKYMEFEGHIGDLMTINKVDRRRRKELEKEFVDCQTLLLIDRYKFMDLFPASVDEIRLLGFPRHALKQLAFGHGLSIFSSMGGTSGAGSSAGTSFRSAELKSVIASNTESEYPLPDTTQMIPFKPRIITTSSYHPVPGGVFPPPPAVAHLMSILPPPVCFSGPFVGVDVLIEKFREAKLPEKIALPSGDPTENGLPANPKMEEVRKDMYYLLANTTDPAQIIQEGGSAAMSARKRRETQDDDLSESAVPPAQDIYRMRQQSKRPKI